MITLRFPCFGFPPMMSLPSVASTFLKGVSSMDLPAYWFSSGLTSKLSTWLTPPQRKIQMTDLARGGKCGLPSGGRQLEAGDSPRATPSRNNIAESESGETHSGVQEEGTSGNAGAAARSADFSPQGVGRRRGVEDSPTRICTA